METPVLPEGVTLDKLLKLYEKNKKSLERRNEWYKTDEGRAYQRLMAKKHYEKHKEEILEKRASRYLEKGEDINQKNKEYYQKNKEKILAKRKEAKNAEA